MEIERDRILFPVRQQRRQQPRGLLQRPFLEKNEKYQNFKKILSENTNEYCQNSTLHGLKYIVDDHLYPAERIFFAISVLMVIGVSAFFIGNVYTKWQTTPVIVGISPEPSFIVDEPFPAVTLCNLNQASKKRAQRYSVDSSEYAMLQILCKREFNATIAEAIDWNTFKDFIVNISQPCDEMIIACNYGAMDYDCNKIFRTIVTSEGLCCAFNALDPRFMFKNIPSHMLNLTYDYTDDATAVDWGPEKGYRKPLPENYYPRNAVGTGETLGLSLTFDIDVNDYFCSSATSVGLKMTLHSPAEIPHVKEIGTLLPAGNEVRIRIRPDKTEAANKLKSIDRKHRQCLFQSEANLTYFTHYNRRNCEFECQTKQLLRECQCVYYFMPVVDESARICGVRDNTCADRLSQNMKNRSVAILEECQQICWASCFDLSYTNDFSAAPISHAGFQIANKFVKNMSSEYAEKNMAVLHLFFTDNMFRSTKQSEFIGVADFLSSVGGLMSLFMGFSILSIAEFIYYAILRPYHVIRRHERIRGFNHQHPQPKAKEIVIPPRNPINHIHIPEYLVRSRKLQVHPYTNTYPNINNELFNETK